MKILIVCSGNEGYISPFIKEQAEAIAALNNEVSIFPIVGKGIYGYLKNLPKIKMQIKKFLPDIIHAHYGFSGLLTSFAKQNHPLIITFHGNDINPMDINVKKNNFNRFLSKIAARNSNYSIFVNEDFVRKINIESIEYSVVPCHVDLDKFSQIDKNAARTQLGFLHEIKYVLFSSSFDNSIKNYALAVKASENIKDIKIIELKGYSREEVNLLLNACDLALLTSFNEGSPQFIKEAMACNCPIVSTDVGDVKWVIGETEGCYVTSFEPDDVASKIKLALDFSQKVGRTKGRDQIIKLGLDSATITKRIIEIYKKVLKS